MFLVCVRFVVVRIATSIPVSGPDRAIMYLARWYQDKMLRAPFTSTRITKTFSPARCNSLAGMKPQLCGLACCAADLFNGYHHTIKCQRFMSAVFRTRLL
jgi:hypothetical protein